MKLSKEYKDKLVKWRKTTEGTKRFDLGRSKNMSWSKRGRPG